MPKQAGQAQATEEFRRLETSPVLPEEREAAERSIARFARKGDSGVVAAEGWVQLYIAFRRARCGDGAGAQIALAPIKSWHAKVTHS